MRVFDIKCTNLKRVSLIIIHLFLNFKKIIMYLCIINIKIKNTYISNVINIINIVLLLYGMNSSFF